MVTRRFVLSTVGAGVAAGGWVGLVEPAWFQVTHTDVRIPGIRPRTILHLSDLHASDGLTPHDLMRGLKSGLSYKPDLICLTGDYVSFLHGFDAKGLRDLMREAAGSTPTFAVMGNHDGGVWLKRHGGSDSPSRLIDLLQAAGVRVLENEAVLHEGMNVVGMADYWSGRFLPNRAFQNVDRSRPTLVLSHNPDSKDRLGSLPWNLMLAGHTHGGQARIPGVTPYWIPVVDQRFIAGLYEWNGRQLFINRGLGSPKHVRAFCRPEVSILHVG